MLARELADLDSLFFDGLRRLEVSGSTNEGVRCSSKRSLFEEVGIDVEQGNTESGCSGLGLGSRTEDAP